MTESREISNKGRIGEIKRLVRNAPVSSPAWVAPAFADLLSALDEVTAERDAATARAEEWRTLQASTYELRLAAEKRAATTSEAEAARTREGIRSIIATGESTGYLTAMIDTAKALLTEALSPSPAEKAPEPAPSEEALDMRSLIDEAALELACAIRSLAAAEAAFPTSENHDAMQRLIDAVTEFADRLARGRG